MQKAVFYFIAVFGLVVVASSLAKEVDLKLDFGTDQPSGGGWIKVTPAGAVDKSIKFRWVLPPTSALDCAFAYPMDPVGRDSVRFTSESPCEFEIDLPEGSYDLSALLGERDDAWRPGMFLEFNGKRCISEAYGFSGTPLWARARVYHPGGKARVRLGSERPKLATGSILGLRLKTASGEQWIASTVDAEAWNPSIRWIAREKIRMIYGMSALYQYDVDRKEFADVTDALWKRGASIGMNSVAARYSAPMAKFFTDRGMKFMHIIAYATGESFSLRQNEFQKNVLRDGREDSRPSPLDETAWRELVVKEALDVWQRSLSDGVPLTGIVIDLEMYGANYMEVYSNGCTFDERSFLDFCRQSFPELPSPEKIAPAARFKTLVDASKINAYYEFLEHRMTEIGRMIEQEIHQKAPDLLIGYLQHFDNWFFRGLDKGIGTKEMPVIAFGENTYYGYNGEAPFEIAALSDLGAHVIYCPGLWPQTMHPEKLWKDALIAGVEAPGYWLYGYGDPMAKEDRVADLDAAIRKANSALDVFLKDGKLPVIGEIDRSLKSPFKKREDAVSFDLVDADPHVTKQVVIPDWSQAIKKYDFGRPESPLQKDGWERVTSLDLWDAQKGFGWSESPRFSFNRAENALKVLENRGNLDLLSDGIVIAQRNTFSAKVPPGNYKVSVILGDLAPNEYRTHQNVKVNGSPAASDVTTNKEEYRIFSASAAAPDGLIHVALEGRGAQQYVSALGLVIEPVTVNGNHAD